MFYLKIRINGYIISKYKMNRQADSFVMNRYKKTLVQIISAMIKATIYKFLQRAGGWCESVKD